MTSAELYRFSRGRGRDIRWQKCHDKDPRNEQSNREHWAMFVKDLPTKQREVAILGFFDGLRGI